MKGRLVLAGMSLALACVPAAAHAQLKPPRAAITAGPSGEVAETTASFSFEATGDLSAFTSFECRLDAAAWAPCTTPWALTDLGGGRHAFEVRLVGGLADSRPDRREWMVAQKTEVLPCGGKPCASPLPEPPAIPVEPQPPRVDRRRDARGCAYGANEPGEVSAVRIRRAVRCLVNVERRKHDLKALRLDVRLERAATRHARDMVSRAYFSHSSPGGSRVAERARAAGYLRGVRYWTVGEVLAWFVRPRPTPVAVVDAWMRSRPHRAVILRGNFRELGAAFAHGNPRVERANGATFAAVLGRRGS